MRYDIRDYSGTTMTNLMQTASRYAASARGRNRPASVNNLAIMNLVDWVAVTLGARQAPAAQKVQRVVAGWGMQGVAPMLLGGTSAPIGAALVNGTMAHCLDFDDLHFPSLAHLSAPTWAAVLALGAQHHAEESLMLDAFLAGFEVSARLGANGVGKAVTDRGWHSTGVHGRISAAIASGVILGLNEQQMAHAIAVAATQTSGLTTSFGTMAKPFHAGKAAADGVLAAELAAAEFEGATQILDDERSLLSALVQDQSVQMSLATLGEDWEIERNALKPYACCGLTHAPIDCGRAIYAQLHGAAVTEVEVTTHELAGKVANQRRPTTGLGGKFSLSYCVALALTGYRATETDFSDTRLAEEGIRVLEDRVRLVADNTLEPSAARMTAKLDDGRSLSADVAVSLGNPENPMNWLHLRDKFSSLVEPALGDRTEALFDTLKGFEAPGAFATAQAAMH